MNETDKTSIPTTTPKPVVKSVKIILYVFIVLFFAVLLIAYPFFRIMFRGKPFDATVICIYTMMIMITGVLMAGIYRAMFAPDLKDDTSPSTQRLNTVNEALKAYCGPHWPAIFITFLILLIIILGLLFTTTRNGIEINDKNTLFYKIFFGSTLGVLTILITALTVVAWLEYTYQNNVNPFATTAQQKMFNTIMSPNQVAGIVGIVLFIVFVMGFFISYIIQKRQSKPLFGKIKGSSAPSQTFQSQKKTKSL
jgi:hypothetical protein